MDSPYTNPYRWTRFRRHDKLTFEPMREIDQGKRHAFNAFWKNNGNKVAQCGVSTQPKSFFDKISTVKE